MSLNPAKLKDVNAIPNSNISQILLDMIIQKIVWLLDFVIGENLLLILFIKH